MTEIMMALGPFSFALESAPYERLARTLSFRWPAVSRMQRRPALQFAGPGAETVELSGILYPGTTGGVSVIKELQELARQGVAHMLADGRGNIWGRFVIESITETHTHLFADGTPRKIEFRLRLSAYGDES